MQNKNILYFIDILESIELIEKYLFDITEEEFKSNIEKQDSIIRRLEIIGEATNNLESQIKDKYSEIPWKSIVAMRNRLIHEYFGVDILKVWDVVKVEIPKLKNVINELLKSDTDQDLA